jgi:hypothetical protein
MRLLLFGFLTCLAIDLAAQKNKFNPERKYHPDSLKRWTKSILKGTSEKHPGFYRYTTTFLSDDLDLFVMRI